MFGYVTAYQPELKMKDYYKYRAYYCGLCQVLKKRYGFLGQLTLTYDMTFLIMLLNSLYEKEMTFEEKRCVVHPVREQKILYNSFTEYAADMNVVLAYLNFVDDWEDERSKAGWAGMHAFRKAYRRLEKNYSEKCLIIEKCLQELAQCEQQKVTDIDQVSSHFGHLMGELFVYQKDVWEPTLREMGFYLGKYIYILDAWDDVEEDARKGNYNPFTDQKDHPEFIEQCREMLTYVLAECTSCFERLPCIEDVEILRNILYAGVWEKFEKKQKEDKEL